MHYVITVHVPDLRIGEQSESLSVRRPNCVLGLRTQRSLTEHEYRIFNYSDIPYISYNEMWRRVKIILLYWESGMNSVREILCLYISQTTPTGTIPPP